MRILGIDPGTIRVGWGVVDALGSRYVGVAHGVLECPPDEPPAERLAKALDAIAGILETYRPDAVAVEDGFAGPNPRAALRVGEGRGVALAAAGRAGVPVTLYAPTVVKRAVAATGRAGKVSVARMVALLLGLREVPESDAADALAVALCHGQRALVRTVIAGTGAPGASVKLFAAPR